MRVWGENRPLAGYQQVRLPLFSPLHEGSGKGRVTATVKVGRGGHVGTHAHSFVGCRCVCSIL